MSMIVFTASDSSEGEGKNLDTSKDANWFDLPSTASLRRRGKPLRCPEPPRPCPALGGPISHVDRSLGLDCGLLPPCPRRLLNACGARGPGSPHRL